MSAPTTLRPLRASDIDRVLELERFLFGPGAWTYGMIADELAAPGRWYVAAVPECPFTAGEPPLVGYAGLWFDGDVTQIMTIGVDPEYQHHGVGTQIMHALLNRSVKLGASAVLLEVRVDNDAALRLYNRLGFTKLGVRKRYYQPENVDAYTMRLDLPPAGAGDEPEPHDEELPAP